MAVPPKTGSRKKLETTQADDLARVIDASAPARWPKLIAAAVVVGVVLAVAGAFRPLPRTPLGGGRRVMFWRDVVVRQNLALPKVNVVRLRSEHHGQRLEALYVTGIRARPPATVVMDLYGRAVVLTGTAPILGEGILAVPGEQAHVGRLRAWFDGDEAWIVTANADDDGSFAASAESERFLSSFGR